MADADVAITAGTGTKVDTRTVGAGTDEHRQVVVVGDPTTAANVQAVSAGGAALVDTELPAAAALSDTTANPTSPMVGAGGMVWDEGGSQWVRARMANTSASALTTGVQAVAQHLWTSNTFFPMVTASNSNAGDASAGDYFPAAQMMVYNGATRDRARGDAANGVDVDVTRWPRVSTATLANVASSATSVTIDALNTARLGMMIHNDSTSVLFMKYGTTASATDYTVKMAAGAQWEMPQPIYTGRIDGIWTTANGNARVTEMTA